MEDKDINEKKPNKINKLIVFGVVILAAIIAVFLVVLARDIDKDKKTKPNNKSHNKIESNNGNDSQLSKLIKAKRTKKAIKVLGDDYTYEKWEDEGAGEDIDGWYIYSNKELDNILYDEIYIEKYLTQILCDIDIYSDSITEDEFQSIIQEITHMYGDKYIFEEYTYKAGRGYTCDYKWENKSPYIWIQYGENETGQYLVHIGINNYH